MTTRPERKAALTEMRDMQRDLAPAAAGYLKDLLREDVPFPLAAALVRDWHKAMWSRKLQPRVVAVQMPSNPTQCETCEVVACHSSDCGCDCHVPGKVQL